MKKKNCNQFFAQKLIKNLLFSNKFQKNLEQKFIVTHQSSKTMKRTIKKIRS